MRIRISTSSQRFDELYERLVAVPLCSAGFERHGKSLYFRDELSELGLIRMGGRFSGPGHRSLLLTFRHRFLRDLEQSLPSKVVREAYACPFKFDPLRLDEVEGGKWHYEPYNRNFQPLVLVLEEIDEREMEALLAHLANLVLENGLAWVRRTSPEELRRQLVKYGEGAWIEGLWLEDYDRFLGPPAGAEKSVFEHPAPAPGTVEHLFDSQYLRGEHMSWASVPCDGIYAWFPQFVRGVSELGGGSRRRELLARQASCPRPMDSYAAYGLALAGVLSRSELTGRVLPDIADGYLQDRSITNSREVFVRATEVWPESVWLDAVRERSRAAKRVSAAAFDTLVESSPQHAARILARVEHDVVYLVDRLFPYLSLIAPVLEERIRKVHYGRPLLWWRRKRPTAGAQALLVLFAVLKKRSGEFLARSLHPPLVSILTEVPETRSLSEGLCEAFESLPLEEREGALRGPLEARWELVGRCPTALVLELSLQRLPKLRGPKAELAASSLASMGGIAGPALLAEYRRARGHFRSTLAVALSLAAPPQAALCFREMLAEQSEKIRRCGVRGLLKLGPGSEEQLRIALADPRPRIRELAEEVIEAALPAPFAAVLRRELDLG